ncbi:MAG: hypothetical protein ACI8O8_002909, partial [Oleiphilaceae bacterium]
NKYSRAAQMFSNSYQAAMLGIPQSSGVLIAGHLLMKRWP